MTQPPEKPGSLSGLARLAIAGVVGAGLWLGLFPALARTPAAAAHIRTMQEGRVNPGAMFYSELDPPELVVIPFDTPPVGWTPPEPKRSP